MSLYIKLDEAVTSFNTSSKNLDSTNPSWGIRLNPTDENVVL